jgi:hypothetical protein
VEAGRLEHSNPHRSAELFQAARQARDELARSS